jgi:hypothetical protein
VKSKAKASSFREYTAKTEAESQEDDQGEYTAKTEADSQEDEQDVLTAIAYPYDVYY